MFWIGLIVIGFFIYFAFMQVSRLSFRRRGKQLSEYLKADIEKEGKVQNRIKEWLEKKGLMDYLSPSHLMYEAEKCGVIITKQSYISSFIVGTAVGLVMVIIYFQPVLFLLLPLSPLGGVLAVNLRVYKIKKEYKQAMDAKLTFYMSFLASSLSTYHNLKDALYSILSSLEEPIKKDIEEAYLQSQDGKSVKESFEHIVQKYPHQFVKLYHDQLHVIVSTGSTDMSSLRDIAFDMKKRETYRRKLLTQHREKLKVWKTFAFFCLSIPFLFIFVSMDNYLLVMNHMAASVVFALSFTFIGLTYWKLEQLEAYDPTNDTEAYF
ncbi:type II secretion system F family protein [Bacillus sp. JJ722]|uniref:type II secretion system F family protein n=1 Tax=Bacillus sp. JJ722 TaxID=3122973 RepID=UPI002FFF443B